MECLAEILDRGDDAKDLHFRCLSHVLNLGAQDMLKIFNTGSAEHGEEEVPEPQAPDEENGLEEDLTELASIGEIITKVRHLFSKIRYSEQLREKLKSFCKIENIEYIEPVLDIKIRWNSTYDMLLAAVRLMQGLKLLILSQDDLMQYFLSEIEWDSVGIIVNILFHFKKVSDLLCGEKYVTLPSVIAALNCMLDKIEQTVETLDKKIDRSEIDELLIFALQAARDKMLKHYYKCNR